MRKYGEDLITRIKELCDMYKRYLSVYKDGRLDILIQNNILSLKLYREIELKDEFEIVFDQKEKDIYLCLSITIMRLLFDKDKIFNGHDVFYNRLDNPNIILSLYDDYVLDMIIMMIASNGANVIYMNVCNNLSFRFYPKKIIKRLDERIKISRKLLRMGDV